MYVTIGCNVGVAYSTDVEGGIDQGVGASNAVKVLTKEHVDDITSTPPRRFNLL